MFALNNHCTDEQKAEIPGKLIHATRGTVAHFLLPTEINLSFYRRIYDGTGNIDGTQSLNGS